jgi:hypothetical protein
LQERTESRLEKIQERQDAAREREREERRRSEENNKPKGLGEFVEMAKGLKEVSELFGGGGGDSSIVDKLFGLIQNPDALQGITGIVAAIKSGGEEYEGDEHENERAIETTANEAPRQETAVAKRPPLAMVRPEEMARTEYPAAFDQPLAVIVESSAKEAPEAGGALEQVQNVMKAFDFLVKNDPEWKRIIMGALMRIAFKGPKLVQPYIHEFLGGLVKAGKLPQENADVLEKVFAGNAAVIVQHIKSRMVTPS